MASSTRWGGQPETTFAEGQRKFKTGRYPGTLPPEVHFQVSKKIAQLTKVIYTLNARLDEQESVMEALKSAYEERLQQLLNESKQKITQYKAKANASIELHQKLTEMESHLSQEKKAKEELEAALRLAEDRKVNGCKTCGHLPNGIFLKTLRKEFDFVSKCSRKKEEEMEIIERILRKKNALKMDSTNNQNGNTNNNNNNNNLAPNVGLLQANDPLSARVRQSVLVVDIPEKDTQNQHREGGHSSSAAAAEAGTAEERINGAALDPSTSTLPEPSGSEFQPKKPPQCLKTEPEMLEKIVLDHKEKELQTRLSESQKETLRLQVDIKKLERAMARRDEELRTLKEKVNCKRESVSLQTDPQFENKKKEEEEESGRASESGDEVSAAKRVHLELGETLSGLQAVSSALKLTKEEVDSRQKELATSLFASSHRVSSIESYTQTEKRSSSRTSEEEEQEELFHVSENGCNLTSEGIPNEKSKEELKVKISQLLEQMTILMRTGDLTSGNRSDAEKECDELKRVLREKEEHFRKTISNRTKEMQLKMAAALEVKDADFLVCEKASRQEHNRAMEALTLKCAMETKLAVQETETRLQTRNENSKMEHDTQLKKLESEVGEMTRRLQSQTELQTAEMARLNHELLEALRNLRKMEEESSIRELNSSKMIEEEKVKSKLLESEFEQSRNQNELLSNQLDLKRDEVLQVRREATQQIRNLENYWLEKVNQELSRIRRAFTEEKKNMIENFCKSQRLLKDKISALQTPCGLDLKRDDINYSFNDLNRIRRDSNLSTRSELVLGTILHEEEDEEDETDLISVSSETIEECNERICASQPNVAIISTGQTTTSAATPLPTVGAKGRPTKERFLSEQRFIKRAESVLLPKLQFLSFWKSASGLEKAANKKQQQRSASCSSSIFPRPLEKGPVNVNVKAELEQQSKRSKMSPSFYRHSSQAKNVSAAYARMGLQESRSSSCFNLSCKIGNSVFNSNAIGEGLSAAGGGSPGGGGLSKLANKRNSLGSTRWLGVVQESGEGEDHSSNPGSDVEENLHLPSSPPPRKEPLLESEL